MTKQIVTPEAVYLQGYVAALNQGYSPEHGGVLVERFTKPSQFDSTPGLRYRIALSA